MSSIKARRAAKLSMRSKENVAAAAPSIREARAMMVLTPNVAVSAPPVSTLCSRLVETVGLRQDYIIAQGNLDRQIKRIVARFTGKASTRKRDKDAPRQMVIDKDVAAFLDVGDPAAVKHLQDMMVLRDKAAELRGHYDKTCAELAKQLPAHESFVEKVSGFGSIGLACIVGSTGDLANYDGPAKVWKRLGLHVINGRSGSTWRRFGGLTKAEWMEAGYSPRRRSVMFVIADSLLRRKDNSYYPYYVACKQREVEKAQAEGLTVAPAADIPQDERERYRSLKHVDLRARRKVAKKLLKDLWRAWRGHVASDGQSTNAPAPSWTESAAQAMGAVPLVANHYLPAQQTLSASDASYTAPNKARTDVRQKRSLSARGATSTMPSTAILRVRLEQSPSASGAREIMPQNASRQFRQKPTPSARARRPRIAQKGQRSTARRGQSLSMQEARMGLPDSAINSVPPAPSWQPPLGAGLFLAAHGDED